MKKVLITGATGFLGSSLAKRLAEEGLLLKILHREKSSLEALKGLTFESVIGDLYQADVLEKACQDVDAVFHLAGVVAYKSSQRSLMERVNILGTKNMAEAALKNKVDRFIHVSSVCAIGASFDSHTILNETSEYNLTPLNLGYFETKKAGEDLVKKAVQKGLNAVIVNPSTTYGYGDGLKGSRKMQVKVAQGKMPFYSPGGINVVALEDVVEGMVQAWKVGRIGERYILANENMTIKNLFEKIARAAGAKPPLYKLNKTILVAAGQLGDVMERVKLKAFITKENAIVSCLYHWFDSKKAQTELGLKFKSADVAIENSVRWMKDQHLV